jgi:TonB family protein
MLEAAYLLLAALASVLGCACLALALPRHWREVADVAMPAGRATSLRAAGFSLLFAGVACAWLRDGPSFGSALAALVLAVSAWAVAFTLSWRPRWLRPLTLSAPATTGAPPAAGDASLTALFTSALWLACLSIGTVGFMLPGPRPQPRRPEPVSVVVERLEVELAAVPPEPSVMPDAPLPDLASPPPLAEPAAAPPPAALVAVAPPSALLAFALPVEGATEVTDLERASHSRPSHRVSPGVASSPPLQTITYGQGEGKQTAPDYPERALREGQEGEVVVRFQVAEDGRVRTAELARPSPWPLLNTAALRVVRRRWSFSPGRARLYEVSIRFELAK